MFHDYPHRLLGCVIDSLTLPTVKSTHAQVATAPQVELESAPVLKSQCESLAQTTILVRWLPGG